MNEIKFWVWHETKKVFPMAEFYGGSYMMIETTNSEINLRFLPFKLWEWKRWKFLFDNNRTMFVNPWFYVCIHERWRYNNGN